METSRKQRDRATISLYAGHRAPKGLYCEKNRHGKEVWYFREGHGLRIRMKDPNGNDLVHGTKAFADRYYALRNSRTDAPPTTPSAAVLAHNDPASFGWLIEKFLASPKVTGKAEATQKARRNVLRRIASKNGHHATSDVDSLYIRALRDNIAARGKVPMANQAVAILRVMFKWAVKEGLAHTNPCLDVEAVDHKGGSNHCWTEAEMTRFEEFYPLGTRERLAYALMIYTGQRSSDVVKMGRQHIKNGLMTVTQKKTNKAAYIPTLPDLEEAIAAGPTGDLLFLASDDGTPLQVSTFGAWFRKACDRAGVPECTPHGLRHAAASRCAERGASVSFLMAVFGFTLQTAARYVQGADLKRSAMREAHFLAKNTAA